MWKCKVLCAFSPTPKGLDFKVSAMRTLEGVVPAALMSQVTVVQVLCTTCLSLLL